MRSHPTSVERNLWWRLRDRKLGGLKFRRQRPEGSYIADFVCLEAKLIVEVDGAQHEGSIGDRYRTQDMKRMGFDVIRFSNDRCGVTSDGLKARVVTGMMATYEELLDKLIVPHTWMLFPAGLGQVGDVPDLAACAAPKPLLVQYALGDAMFTEQGMRDADKRIGE